MADTDDVIGVENLFLLHDSYMIEPDQTEIQKCNRDSIADS